MLAKFDSLVAFVTKYSSQFIIAIFMLIFIVGMVNVTSYGIGVDEPEDHDVLLSNVSHVLKTLNPRAYQKAHDRNPEYFDGIKNLAEHPGRTNGQSIHFLTGYLSMMDASYNPGGTQGNGPFWTFNFNSHLYLSRHYFNFLLCFIGMIYFYLITRFLTKKPLFGLLCVIFVLISPRFFAEMIYNTRDMAVFALMGPAIYHGLQYIYTKGIGQLIGFCAVCAFAVNIRPAALALPVVIFLFAIICFAFGSRRAGLSGWISLGLFPFLLAGFYYLITPAAWSNCAGFVGQIIHPNPDYTPWSWSGKLLFEGKYYSNFSGDLPSLPFYYLPKMILITTPVVVTLLFLLGLFFTFRRVSSFKFKDYLSSIDALAAPVLCFTLISIILPAILNSRIYNGWRFIYFCYAGIVIIAAYSVSVILKNFNFKLTQNEPEIPLPSDDGEDFYSFMASLETSKYDFDEKALELPDAPPPPKPPAWRGFWINHGKGIARASQWAVVCVIALQICLSLGWQIFNHPYQFLYYNALAGKNVQNRYEGDYWNVGGQRLIRTAFEDIGTGKDMHIGSLDFYSTWGIYRGYEIWPESVRVILEEDADDADFIFMNPMYYIADNQGDEVLADFSSIYTKMSAGKKCYAVYINGDPMLVLFPAGDAGADSPSPE